MKKYKLFLLAIIAGIALLNGQSSTSSYTQSLRFFNSDLLQIYQGARIAAPSMTLPSSTTTYTSTLKFTNSDNLQIYNAVRGIGQAVSSGTATSWNLLGNSVSTNTTFIGTTSNRSLLFKTNNIQRLKLDSLGSFIWDAPSGGYSNKVQISQWPGFTDIPAFYMGVSAPTTTNYAILADGSNNVFNAPASLSFRTANSVVFLAQNTSTASASIFLLAGFSKTVAASSNFIQLDVQGNDITFPTGTTVAQRKQYLRGDALKSSSTATITDAVSLEIEDPTASSGMTFTRKWALRARGNAIFNGSVTIGTALTTTAPSSFYVNGTMSVSSTATVNGLSSTTGNFSGNLVGSICFFSTAQLDQIYPQSNVDLVISTRAGVGTKSILFRTKGTTPTEAMRINENGNVLIGTTTNVPTALLNMSSTTQGFLPPRMTDIQLAAIASPATGLTVYCTNCTANDATAGVMVTYNGSTWKNHW